MNWQLNDMQTPTPLIFSTNVNLTEKNQIPGFQNIYSSNVFRNGPTETPVISQTFKEQYSFPKGTLFEGCRECRSPG